MKIQQLKPQNRTLQDLRKLKEHTNMSKSSQRSKRVRFGLSTIYISPEVKSQNINDIIRIDNSPELKETKFDKFLNKLDEFSEPIIITKKEMKEYTKQIVDRMASLRKIFG